MFSVLFLVAPAWSLSLDEAVDAALLRSPVSELAEARVDEARAKVWQATAPMLPRASVSGGSLWQKEVIVDFRYALIDALEAGTGGAPQPSEFDEVDWPTLQFPQQWQFSLDGQQALVVPQAWLWRRAARQGEALAGEQGEADLYQLGAYVLQAWHASARHAALLQDAQEALALAERIETLADTLVENGVATTDQLLQVQAALAAARATVARAQAASSAADAALKLMTGRDEPADAFQVPAALPSLDQALAQLNRPDQQLAAQQLEAAQAVVWAERSGAMPVIGLTGQYYGIEPYSEFVEQWNYKVQLGFTVPFLNGGAVAAKVSEAKAQREKARAAQRLITEQAELEVIQTHGELAAAMASLQERKTALDLANQAVTAAENRLKNGAGSLLDLKQAQGGLAEARVRLTLAKADAAQAADQLRQVTRGL